MEIPVSQLIVRYLEQLGVEHIFGMPGAHILPVYDAIYDSPIEAILAKHEQGAAFMASGYNRASGKIGACIATAGPGATNLITGIANAYVDKQAVIAITGETSTAIFGKGGLQESSGEGGSIDQAALFSSITRYHRVVERSDYLANVLNQISNILLAECPGPVLLSLPYNVQKEPVDDAILDDIKTSQASYRVLQHSPPIDALSEHLKQAQHPVIIAGYGAIRAGAQQSLTQLAERLQIPVTSSLKAKGILDENHPLALGSLGVTSSGYAKRYIETQADLLLFLGASFNERTSYLWKGDLLKNKTLIQIDHNPAQIDKVLHTDLAITGDIQDALNALHQRLDQHPIPAKTLAHPPGTQRLAETNAGGLRDSIFNQDFLLIDRLFAALEKHFPSGIQLFDDNIIFAQNFYNVAAANHYYPNSGVSSLGQAIPAAIGARFTREQPTFAILGDGGFQMCCMELMTAVNYNIPLNIILFNNATMGLIRKNQHQQYQRRYINCDFQNPDYAQLAQSFGINHQRIDHPDQLHALFTDTDFHHAINLIEITIDKNAFPNYQSGR